MGKDIRNWNQWYSNVFSEFLWKFKAFFNLCNICQECDKILKIEGFFYIQLHKNGTMKWHFVFCKWSQNLRAFKVYYCNWNILRFFLLAKTSITSYYYFFQIKLFNLIVIIWFSRKDGNFGFKIFLFILTFIWKRSEQCFLDCFITKLVFK